MRVGNKNINEDTGLTNIIENQQLLTMQAITDRREQLGFHNACLASVERSLLSATRGAEYGIMACNEEYPIDVMNGIGDNENNRETAEECISIVERGYMAQAVRLHGHSTLCI